MTDLVETMNNKIHDGDDGMEIGDGDNILPVAMVRQIERKRQHKMVLLMYSAAVLQFVLGVFVMILNIIFIYDGMNSKWYGQVDDLNEATNVDEDGNIISTGGGMKVVSIGEGILAGFFYILLAGVAMILIAKKGQNKKALIGIHACLLLLSFTVVIANACQIGLIHQYATPYDAENSKWYGEEPRQTAVVALELVGNFIVFIFSTVALLVVPNMK